MIGVPACRRDVYHERMFARLLLVALILSAGCGPGGEVSRYKAPKDPTWRLMGAIFPHPESTWFFKLVGPSGRIAPHSEKFGPLVKSARFEGGDLRWTAPEGWTEEAGAGERRATLRVDSTKPPLEMTVVRLPAQAGGVLDNVNRWRQQIGLGAIREADLASHSTRIDVGGIPVTLVDMTGPLQPAAGPMAPAPRPSVADVRQIFAFESPAGWTENPHPPEGRILEFRAGAAMISLSVLPGESGGLAANVNRWRNQLGLSPLEGGAAEALAKPFDFMSRGGFRVELAGAERAIDCVFSISSEFSVFLKLDGPPAAVETERARFEAFARTLRVRR